MGLCSIESELAGKLSRHRHLFDRYGKTSQLLSLTTAGRVGWGSSAKINATLDNSRRILLSEDTKDVARTIFIA